MSKDERLTLYLDEDEKRAIESAADREDTPMSVWVREAVEYRLREQQQDELTQATEAEERIERLIDQATNEIETATTEAVDGIESSLSGLREVHALTGVYSLASWKLLATGFSEQQQNASLGYGSNRLSGDLEAVGIDVPEPENIADDRDGDTSARAETRAEEDSEDSDDDRDDGSVTGLFDDD